MRVVFFFFFSLMLFPWFLWRKSLEGGVEIYLQSFTLQLTLLDTFSITVRHTSFWGHKNMYLQGSLLHSCPPDPGLEIGTVGGGGGWRGFWHCGPPPPGKVVLMEIRECLVLESECSLINYISLFWTEGLPWWLRKNLPVMWETQVRSLDQEDALE